MFTKDKAYEITNIELLSSYSSNASSVQLEYTEHSQRY